MIARNTILSLRQLPEEFEAIFQEHSEFVFRTAYRVTGSAEDAEDAMRLCFQSCFESASSRHSAETESVRHRSGQRLNVVRSRKNHVLTDRSDLFESGGPAHQSDKDADIQECLRLALADLKPRAAEIFILRYVHGYSDAEIGTLLGTSRGTIAISLFRSRSRLRKSIRSYQGEKS